MPPRYYAVSASAFALAAVASASIGATIMGSIRILPVAFFVALGHALCLGLPFYRTLRRRNRVNLLNSVIAGFVAAILPSAFFTLPFGGSASINGVAIIVDGAPTIAGWLYYFQTLLYIGGLGIPGGLVFWVVMKASGYLATGNLEVPPRASQFGVASSLAALLAVGIIFTVPAITADRSCHNMSRDGRTSIGPRLSVELNIAHEDWPLLIETFESFAKAHNFSFRDSSRDTPDVVRILGLSLCNENGVVITAMEQRWAHRNYAPMMENRGMPLGIYETQNDSPWQDIGAKFVAALEAQWPGKLKFIGSGGREIPRPEFIPSVNPQ